LLWRAWRGFARVANAKSAPEPKRDRHEVLRVQRRDDLITFWVSVPAETEARAFFSSFNARLPARLAEWRVLRADTDKVGRLGAARAGRQDRITVSDENRARNPAQLRSHRFGKDQSEYVII
jgi:hypothetical protein